MRDLATDFFPISSNALFSLVRQRRCQGSLLFAFAEGVGGVKGFLFGLGCKRVKWRISVQAKRGLTLHQDAMFFFFFEVTLFEDIRENLMHYTASGYRTQPKKEFLRVRYEILYNFFL